MLQRLAGAEHVGMLMAAERTRLGGALRVLLATTHLALRDVPDAVTCTLLCDQTRLLHASLVGGWRLTAPRIALCALNPHASDGGLFGDEEARVLGPAVERLRAEGIDARGPLPADTVFVKALAGELDAVVAPYHDVGMAAFKTAAFGAGVNVTLGLPFVRTSPDHGTAFDIAATWGRADPSSMLEALTLARRLAAARFDTDSGDV
jgi:4-hydroxythreonine-4-phosphate dehydrogenase